MHRGPSRTERRKKENLLSLPDCLSWSLSLPPSAWDTHHPLSRFSGLGAQTAATSVAPLLPELVDGGWWGFPGSQFLLTNLFVGSVSLEDAR